MSLRQKISVNTYYTRSVNLERDVDSLDIIQSYIPTSRALRTFSRITETFKKSQSPRAWSLIGPYGSGKSSFSVFLSHLLSHSSLETTKAAQAILAKTDKTLANLFKTSTNKNEGYLKVLITGSPEPMAKRILHGLLLATENFWEERRGKKPNIVSRLKAAAKKNEIPVSEVLDLIQKLQVALEKENCGGILLVIDELGKFLEYEARHYGANDIFLLQALSEHACKGNQVNLLLFVLLHQSFEQYAKGLGENLKNEWSKVQGRFEEIPFLESAEQVLRVVSAAFSHNLNAKEQAVVLKHTDAALGILSKNEAVPGAMTNKEASALFNDCYPLHPVSAILLPLLCQKVAQNERTLFSYLGSHEDFGLQDMLEKIEEVGEFIYPHHIYDYFITNQSAVMGDYITHRRWAEVVTAIERLGDANEDEVNLLKTIGILNIVGSKGGFKAAKSILETCARSKSAFTRPIKKLTEKSVINFRRFNSEYRVWQGSDFDLEEALQEEKNNLGNYSAAEELKNEKDILPIVARKYTIESGTLRYFQPTFVDAKTYLDTEQESKEARIIYYLAAAKDDEEIFKKEVKNHFSAVDIVVLCRNGSQLREAITESLALKRVQTNRQELNTDNIAKREFEDRLTAAEYTKDALLNNLLDCPEDSDWFNNTKQLKIQNKRSLQEALSSVLEGVFSKSPKINNEMLNRDKPTAQAVGARLKLLLAMINNQEKDGLAIEKYPPEKAIYRSILLASGLHRKIKGQWKFVPPEKDGRKDKYNIRHAWARINEFLDSTENESKSFVELSEILMAPPYGIKAGVLPILYITAYLCYEHELGVYDNRRYRTTFTEEMLERFIKRPDEYTFQRFCIKGLREPLFKAYAKALSSFNSRHINTNIKNNILDIAKPIAQIIGNLPEYTQKTRRGLSSKAYKVRNAFNLAKSPESLIFTELPEALGFKNLNIEDVKKLEKFCESLTKTLHELNGAYTKLLNKQKELLAHAFSHNPKIVLSELRKVLSGHCYGLQDYTIDTEGLRAFILKINKSSGTDDEWLENILMFLGHKPSKKWLDNDQDTAEFRLIDFSRHVIDLEKIRLHEKDVAHKMDGDFDVYLLRSIKKGDDIKDDVIVINEERKKRISHARDEIREKLTELADKDLMLAVLAETVDEFLSKEDTVIDHDTEPVKLKDAGNTK